jgi:hypothetical protein
LLSKTRYGRISIKSKEELIQKEPIMKKLRFIKIKRSNSDINLAPNNDIKDSELDLNINQKTRYKSDY